MARIAIINPTTTEAFATRNLEAGQAVAAAGTEILSVTPAGGPPSIEGHYDEAIAVIGVLEKIRRLETEGVDGYVIACFGDPGIWAARELARGPVLGIAEASFHAASIVATRFSVVTTLPRTCVIARHLLQTLGFADRCARVRSTELEVLALEATGDLARRRIRDECVRALEQDEIGALVLGCAGMADLALGLQAELGVPVIEGVAAGVKLVEALVAMGLQTSKHGDLAAPIAKKYQGRLAHLSPAGSRP